jgi:hypothetical protein
VERPVLLVPQRPQVVDELGEATTSRNIAKPKVIGSPFARTTRMPVTMRPRVCPSVRAIIAGA